MSTDTSASETTAEIQAATEAPEDPKILLTISVERVPPLPGRETPSITRHRSTLSVAAMLRAMGGPGAALSRVLDRVGGQVITNAVGTLIPEAGGNDAAGSRCALDDRFGHPCDGPADRVVVLESTWPAPLADQSTAILVQTPVRLGTSAPVCGNHVEIMTRLLQEGRPEDIRLRAEVIGGVQR